MDGLKLESNLLYLKTKIHNHDFYSIIAQLFQNAISIHTSDTVQNKKAIHLINENQGFLL